MKGNIRRGKGKWGRARIWYEKDLTGLKLRKTRSVGEDGNRELR